MHKIIFPLVATLMCFPPSVGQPATITVNDTNDTLADDGTCTLREAIIAANVNAASGSTSGECTEGSSTEGDAIILPAGTYTLSLEGSGEDDAATGDLDIKGNTTITGAGRDNTIVDASGMTTDPDRVFHIRASSVEVAMTDLTITGGNVSEDSGGGIWFSHLSSSLNLSNCLISENSASSSGTVYGGGIYHQAGTLTVTDCTFSNNTLASSYAPTGSSPAVRGAGIAILKGTATLERIIVSGNSGTATSAGGYAGGVYNQEATITLVDSEIYGNSLSGEKNFSGGGLYNAGTATIESSTFHSNTLNSSSGIIYGAGIDNEEIIYVVNSTVSGNSGTTSTGTAYGGGIMESGTSSDLSNVTIADNVMTSSTSRSYGGGLYITSGSSLTLRNSIISGNTAGTKGSDCYGSITSGGYNLIYDVSDCTIDDDSTHVAATTDPLLGILMENGGTTSTHALGATSSSINAGNPSGCTDGDGNTLLTDQRGYTRDSQCDIGAYEYMANESNNCSDSADNDGDGFADTDDSDCGGMETSCTDSADNDGDGFVDCDDSDCGTDTACVSGSGDTGDSGDSGDSGDTGDSDDSGDSGDSGSGDAGADDTGTDDAGSDDAGTDASRSDSSDNDQSADAGDSDDGDTPDDTNTDDGGDLGTGDEALTPPAPPADEAEGTGGGSCSLNVSTSSTHGSSMMIVLLLAFLPWLIFRRRYRNIVTS